MDAFDDRWAFLRPWCAPLRGKLVLERSLERVDDSSDEFVLYVKMPRTKREAWPVPLRAMRDSLALLSLVAQVDRSAWASVLFMHCEVQIDRSDSRSKAHDLETARLELLVYLETVEDDWQVDMLSLFFSSPAEACRAIEFRNAARQVVARAHPDWFYRSHFWIPVGMSIYVSRFPQHDGLDGLLKRFWRTLKDLHCNDDDRSFRFSISRTSALTCAYRLGPLLVELADPFVTSTAANVIEDIVSCGNGLVVSSLSSSSARLQLEKAAPEPQTVGTMLGRMLGLTDSGRSLVRKVELTNLDSRVFARIASAIVETQTTRELSLAFSRFKAKAGVQRRAWECLAYALFSKRARNRSSISRVQLDGIILSKTDADAVSAVIASSDPASYTFNRKKVSATSYKGHSSMIRRGTLVTLIAMDPMDSPKLKSVHWQLETDVSGVQVLDADSNRGVVRVLVPGYGVCEVMRDHILPGIDEAASQRIATGRVVRLEMQFFNVARAAAGLPQFLEVVGASLTHLILDVPANELLSVGDLLPPCPNLTSLKVGFRAKVNSESFLQAYRASSLRITVLDCFFDDVPLIMSEVADPTTRLAQTLKRLELSTVAPREILSAGRLAQVAAELADVRNMLLANKTLKYLDLTAPRALMEKSCSIAEEFHREELFAVKPECSFKCRLALLSVFRPCQSGRERAAKRPKTQETPSDGVISTPRTRAMLDPHVLSIIFGFAGRPVRRKVYVTSI